MKKRKGKRVYEKRSKERDERGKIKISGTVQLVGGWGGGIKKIMF